MTLPLRILAWCWLIAGLAAEVVKLTALTVVNAVNPRYRSAPAILEVPLRLTSPRELSWMAMSIAITPGSLVLGTALPEDGEPARMYVHILESRGRQRELTALRTLEGRILAVTRGPRERT